jgi:hypothetical protein
MVRKESDLAQELVRDNWQVRRGETIDPAVGAQGYWTYIITTSRITSGEESNQRNGSDDLAIPPPYPATVSPS